MSEKIEPDTDGEPSSEQVTQPEPLIIPHNQLSADALQGVLEEYISREGTAYGMVECDFNDQLKRALAQLEAGKVLIVFDPVSERCQIIDSREYQQWSHNSAHFHD